jgi:tetrapyrrole methylase family protein / MazG family protein
VANQRRRGRRKKPPPRKSRAASGSEVVVTARDRAAGVWFAKLVALQERLCAPGGCPWDREQTHASLRKYLIEEAYEVLDAMQSGDSQEFASELGDLLLQIVFHSVLAEVAGTFTIRDVIEAIYTKMVRRHPHVFGDGKASTAGAVLKKWEEIKAQERAQKKGANAKEQAAESVLSGIPASLPAVLEAYQLTRRASRIGFDWDNLQGIFEKLEEEKRELAELMSDSGKKPQNGSVRTEEEVGDLLFAAINVARFLGVDPEIALKKANRKFKTRFQWMEAAAMSENKRLADVPRDRMEDLWNEAKKAATSAAKSD